MEYATKIFAYIALALCFLNISACGKISDPKPIEGSGYPHIYPRY